MGCSPKDQGGLGFRKMHDFNKAMVMKLGWGLINSPRALWVRVLKSKYGCRSGALLIV